MYLGLGLPLIFDLMPTVSVNTMGTRKVRPVSDINADPAGVDARLTFDSKIDQFETRRQIWRRQHEKVPAARRTIEEEELRALSFYEFC